MEPTARGRKRAKRNGGFGRPRIRNDRVRSYGFALNIGVFLALAAVTLATPFDGVIGLAEIFAWAIYLSVFVVPSPCRAGAAYPFSHGFRSSGCFVEPVDQGEDGTTRA